MFHLLAYQGALGAAAADTDLTRVVDGQFSDRNNHFIFTEPYNLLLAYYQAASATRARFNVPSINGIGRHQLWPVERSATIPDWPGIQDMRDYPMPLPQNEEIAIEGSNDAAGADQTTALLWLASQGWNKNLPRGLQRLVIRATAAATGVAAAWSGDAALTFSDNLKGGWYSIVGCQVFDAGSLAYRFNFRNGNTVNGRKLMPGTLCQEAIGNTPREIFMGGLGVYGQFHSFEPPAVQVYANGAGATTGEMRLDVVYHGERQAA